MDAVALIASERRQWPPLGERSSESSASSLDRRQQFDRQMA